MYFLIISNYYGNLPQCLVCSVGQQDLSLARLNIVIPEREKPIAPMNHATSSILEELPLNIFQKALIVHRTPTVKRKYLRNEPPNFHFLNHRTFNKYVKFFSCFLLNVLCTKETYCQISASTERTTY